MRRTWGLFLLAGVLAGCQSEPAPTAPLPVPSVTVTPPVSEPQPATSEPAAPAVSAATESPLETPSETPSATVATVAAPEKVEAPPPAPPSATPPRMDVFPSVTWHAPAFIHSGDNAQVKVHIRNDGPTEFSGRLRWTASLDDEELDASGTEITVAPGQHTEAAWTVNAPKAGILYCRYHLEDEELRQSPPAGGRIAVFPASIRHREEFSGNLETDESRFLTLQLPETVAPETPRLRVSLIPEEADRPNSPHPSELELKFDGDPLGTVSYRPGDPACPGTATFPLPGDSGPHSLELRRAGAEPCFYRLALEYFERPDTVFAPSPTEVRLERDYYLLQELAEPIPNVPTVTWQNRIYRRVPLTNLNAVAPGDLLEASLTVEAPEAWNARWLTDPIPGGCRNLETARDPVQYQLRIDGGQPARKVFSHLFRAEFPGTYYVPPAVLQLNDTEYAVSTPERIAVEPATGTQTP